VSSFTRGEAQYCEAIREKDYALRAFLAGSALSETIEARRWLMHLNGIKSALGNLNNDLAFVATLLVKSYLAERFGIVDFDAAGKAQGASGEDIVATTVDGRKIIGELKTTKPYQPGFGAAQRTAMLKDIGRLAASSADHRLMFVTDGDAFSALCKPVFARRAAGVEIVELVTGQTFLCPSIG
jgi:hypothetical protein